MEKLINTPLFRAITKSLNRKKISEKKLHAYFSEFAQQTTIICDNMDCRSALRTLNYTQIQFQSLFNRISERPNLPPLYISRFINQAIQLILLEKELLIYRLEHPQIFISKPTFISPLHWSNHYYAICLKEILCGIDLMTPNPIVLADGREASFSIVIQSFEQFLNVKLGNPYEIKRSVLDRKKDRTKFTKALLHTLMNYKEK